MGNPLLVMVTAYLPIGTAPVRARPRSVLSDEPNQINRQRSDISVRARDLLNVSLADGSVTRAGVESNAYVGLAYITAWLGGSGAAAIRNLMEDVATAEISRSQLWQQIRQETVTSDTQEEITERFVLDIIDQQSKALLDDIGASRFHPHGDTASALLKKLVASKGYDDFLTQAAYWELSGVPAPL